MARPLRVQFPGAAYQVMVRGSHGQPIFVDHQDRNLYLETLEEACQRTGRCTNVSLTISRMSRRPAGKCEELKRQRGVSNRTRAKRHNSRTDPFMACENTLRKGRRAQAPSG